MKEERGGGGWCAWAKSQAGGKERRRDEKQVKPQKGTHEGP